MTDDELKAIEAREQAATPGPWERDSDLKYPAIRVAYDTRSPARYRIASVGAAGRADDAADNANATFIAHSRTDVPDLVAEVRRLRESLERIANDECDLGAAVEAMDTLWPREPPDPAKLERRRQLAEAVQTELRKAEPDMNAAIGIENGLDRIRRLRATVPLPCAQCGRREEPRPDAEVKTLSCHHCGRPLGGGS